MVGLSLMDCLLCLFDVWTFMTFADWTVCHGYFIVGLSARGISELNSLSRAFEVYTVCQVNTRIGMSVTGT